MEEHAYSVYVQLFIQVRVAQGPKNMFMHVSLTDESKTLSLSLNLIKIVLGPSQSAYRTV